ncbi:MAG: hypothetical protein JW861_06860 [Bacteroidales bacterium]|nr:hypothetical protein [Bacteroidales bacterium]
MTGTRTIRVVIFFVALLIVTPGGICRDSAGMTPDMHHDTVSLPVYGIRVELPRVVMRGITKEIRLQITDGEIMRALEGKRVRIRLNDSLSYFPEVTHGMLAISYSFPCSETLVISSGPFHSQHHLNPIPLWLSILPPLVAIMIALLLREVFTALVIGLFIGATTIAYYQGRTIAGAMFAGFLSSIDTYIPESVLDASHLSIILFSMMIGATVNLISDNGGMRGVVNLLSRFASSPRSGQLVTWLLGVAIFFDDYANTLVVGNTMRPVTDRLKISREKLSYIVDSTAAPVASVAFVTTWIGAELSYIHDGITTLALDETPYDVFIRSLQYSFYPLLTLAFIVILLIMRRDYGPMLHAERMARKQITSPGFIPIDVDEGKAGRDGPERGRWFNAVIPVVVIVGGTITGLAHTGLMETGWDPGLSFSKNLSLVIGHSDSYRSLLWSSFAGLITALLLTVSQRIMNLERCVESLLNGFRTMLTAVLILVLAWSIALMTKYMNTADFISGIMIDFHLAPALLPALTFILSALVAFSTGSSWGTMAILYPLILPSSWLIARESGLGYDSSMAIFHNVVSCVLAGSVLGDHCSPISDTTILSSLASSCRHIEHVRTQLPYALTVGSVAVFFGSLPAAFGVPTLLLIPVNMVILFLIIRFFGKKTEIGVPWDFR